MKKITLLSFLLVVNFLSAQRRVDRPVQIQVNMSGLFVDVMANTLADNTVDDLEVNSWLPGVSVGYHVNRYLYFGYSIYSPLDLTLKESWGLNPTVQDANIILDHQTGIVQNLEARISPFRFGFYASVGIANVPHIKYQMDFNRKESEVLIGSSAYQTDLDITWNSKRTSSLTLGLGYTHVATNGLSFTVGLNVPVNFPDDENILFSSDEVISSSDLNFARNQIQEETFYGPAILYLNIGYNLKKFW